MVSSSLNVTAPAPPASATQLNPSQVLKNHEKWIRSIARKYAGTGGAVLFDDLVQEGFMALALAMKTWSPDGGASLTTYARDPVRTAMLRHATREKSCGMNRRAGRMKATNIYAQSMDAPASVHDDSNLHDTLAGEQASPEDEMIAAERVAMVRAALETVPERDRSIVRDAMSGDEYRTIGRRLGVSKSRVEQVVAKWLPVLRKRLTKDLADGC
jgi:RNA polymerase sigma factor (sigma-70 family)